MCSAWDSEAFGSATGGAAGLVLLGLEPDGFGLSASSANARTKPGYLLEWAGRPAESALKDPAFYKAIGESDRMTLRFRKPK